MYIAFKWLVFLSLTMWLAICVVDLFYKYTIKIRNPGVDSRQYGVVFKNKSLNTELLDVLPHTTRGTIKNTYYDQEQSLAGLHYLMFIAGALAVTAFRNKRDIITFAHQKISIINFSSSAKKILYYLRKSASKSRVTMSKYLLYFWESINMVSFKLVNQIRSWKVKRSVKQNKIHVILLKRLKEMGEERKNLGQLLISAIHENKNIRMRYELEIMTKNRLMQHIEDTQKQMKEHRLRYVNFQQLYLVTHQENTYLKARVGKLKQDKVDTEKNLMGLVSEVYRSENKKLKAYCSRFLVKTKDKLLNSDVSAEIHEFLENSCRLSKRKNSRSFEGLNTNDGSEKVWPSYSSVRITEIINEDDSIVPLVSKAPTLRGLPGEYVWSIKDKNGLIEKLYDHDYESDFDNGEIVRRIRQYSVYIDKDCLLDWSKMETENSDVRSIMLNQPLRAQNIVTGSEAFQKFLQNNNSIVQIKQPASPLICG